MSFVFNKYLNLSYKPFILQTIVLPKYYLPSISTFSKLSLIFQRTLLSLIWKKTERFYRKVWLFPKAVYQRLHVYKYTQIQQDEGTKKHSEINATHTCWKMSNLLPIITSGNKNGDIIFLSCKEGNTTLQEVFLTNLSWWKLNLYTENFKGLLVYPNTDGKLSFFLWYRLGFLNKPESYHSSRSINYSNLQPVGYTQWP